MVIAMKQLYILYHRQLQGSIPDMNAYKMMGILAAPQLY